MNMKIYSNCDEVELLLNDKSIGRQLPDKDQYSTNLKHPPFTFHLNTFTAGTLKAVGYINNKKIIQEIRSTHETAAKINLHADYSGKELKAGQNDIIFIYADVTDNNETIIYNAKNLIEFDVTGDAEIVGLRTMPAEAGTATILLKAGENAGEIKISAVSKGLKSADISVYSK